MQARHSVRGVTLIEMMVVLAILGVTLGVVGIATIGLRPPLESGWRAEFRHARAEAIRTSRRTRASPDSGVNLSPLPSPVVFLPDGRALGSGVDPLTGAPR
jgi:prepilin-type N-terminal cleavage/methylation domain-containing protein